MRSLAARRIGAIVVVDAGRICGIISERDIVRALSRSGPEALSGRVSEIMTRDVVTVTDTTPIAAVAHLMETRRIKRVPVTREGRLVGIVSRRNLLQALATTLSVAAVTPDDRAIRDAFYAELRRQAWAGGSGAINAVVSDGVLHLWGVASDETLRQALVVAAENVPGVRVVEDHMDNPRAVDPLDRPNWPSPARP
jgi:predicted transcriptional regulator